MFAEYGHLETCNIELISHPLDNLIEGSHNGPLKNIFEDRACGFSSSARDFSG